MGSRSRWRGFNRRERKARRENLSSQSKTNAATKYTKHSKHTKKGTVFSFVSFVCSCLSWLIETDGSMIKTVGVIGAGTMGNGIAQVFAQHGFSVRLVDV